MSLFLLVYNDAGTFATPTGAQSLEDSANPLTSVRRGWFAGAPARFILIVLCVNTTTTDDRGEGSRISGTTPGSLFAENIRKIFSFLFCNFNFNSFGVVASAVSKERTYPSRAAKVVRVVRYATLPRQESPRRSAVRAFRFPLERSARP